MAAIARTVASVQAAKNKDSKLSFCPLTSQLMPSVYQTHPEARKQASLVMCGCPEQDRHGWAMALGRAAHAVVKEQVMGLLQ